MYQTKTYKAIVNLGVASVIGVSLLGAPLSVQAKLSGIEPGVVPKVGGKGGPGGRSPGGSRIPDCLGENYLYSLSPRDGITVAMYPTFLVHVPPTKARQARFSLKNENNQIIYKADFDLKSNAINSVSLSGNNSPALKIGKRYEWIFSVVCNAESPDQNPSFNGWITRTELAPSLASQIAQAPFTQRLILYINAGLWYDALLTAAELRRTRPDDSTVGNTWSDLLKAVGLKEVAGAPLF
ncbi:MAG: DUF928 domain-containing protein [Leptolyngbyaceae cyanobacterium HOT.MB2.61]|jgi:hypothetical protein|nr:DUF928 domain-containing protein [Leptolyngbyaceae cyanobacterium HOT.MB2.61]